MVEVLEFPLLTIKFPWWEMQLNADALNRETQVALRNDCAFSTTLVAFSSERQCVV